VADLNAALHEQRRFWKFTGIVVVTMICLYLLVIVGIGVFAGMAAARSM
jgi:hypothetical protein